MNPPKFLFTTCVIFSMVVDLFVNVWGHSTKTLRGCFRFLPDTSEAHLKELRELGLKSACGLIYGICIVSWEFKGTPPMPPPPPENRALIRPY